MLLGEGVASAEIFHVPAFVVLVLRFVFFHLPALFVCRRITTPDLIGLIVPYKVTTVLVVDGVWASESVSVDLTAVAVGIPMTKKARAKAIMPARNFIALRPLYQFRE